MHDVGLELIDELAQTSGAGAHFVEIGPDRGQHRKRT